MAHKKTTSTLNEQMLKKTKEETIRQYKQLEKIYSRSDSDEALNTEHLGALIDKLCTIDKENNVIFKDNTNQYLSREQKQTLKKISQSFAQNLKQPTQKEPQTLNPEAAAFIDRHKPASTEVDDPWADWDYDEVTEDVINLLHNSDSMEAAKRLGEIIRDHDLDQVTPNMDADEIKKLNSILNKIEAEPALLNAFQKHSMHPEERHIANMLLDKGLLLYQQEPLSFSEAINAATDNHFSLAETSAQDPGLVMEAIQRPIVTIDAEGVAKNLDTNHQFDDKSPIFLYKQDENHYQELQIQDGFNAKDILEAIQEEPNKPKPA